MASDDALVLGADIEGLAAAATLAQGGRSVHLVDDGAPIGGMAASRAIGSDHRAPGLHVETGLVRRELLASLELEGLQWHRGPGGALHVVGAEGSLAVPASHDASGLGTDGPPFAEWRGFLERLQGLVREIMDEAPPEPEQPSKLELLSLGRKALRLRGLGEADMMELLRVATLPVWDWTEERFADPRLRAACSASLLSGTQVGPRGAGTSALAILREGLRGSQPVGGLSALADALLRRCEALGVEVHRDARARRIVMRDGRVEALELEDGDTLPAALLLSAVDPPRTLLDLVEPGLITRSLVRELTHWRSRGSSAVFLAALRATPTFVGCTEVPTRFVTCTSPLQLERAADALKYGELPADPWLDGKLWTSEDPGCAPTGGATLVAHVHGVPLKLADGWSDGAREELGDRVLAALERAAPGIGQQIAETELLTPPDLEREYGHTGGHLFRGDLALDQLWTLRPCLELARYDTPLAGLWLGGAGSHPGGPWFGGAGVLAARGALARGGRRTGRRR